MQEIIGIFGDYPSFPTGMAVVLRNIALGLSHHGLRVIYFGRFGQETGFSKEPVMHEDAMSYDLINCEGGVWKPSTVIKALEHYEITHFISEDDWFSASGLVRGSMKTHKPLHLITPIDSLPIHKRAFDIFRKCKKIYVPNSSYKKIKNGRYLPHGCDTRMFYPEQVNREDDIFTFIWVSRDEPRKALGRVIVALEQIYKDVECKLFIHSDWRAKMGKRTARYLRYKRDLPVHLNQMERGSQDMLREIYNNGDVFISSSKAGGFEMGVSESSACGLVPIVTDWTFMNEVMSDDTCFKIPISSVCGDTAMLWNGKRWGIPLGRKWGNISIKELARRMKWCVNHRDEVKEMGEKARQYVKNKYNWTRISGKLAEEMLYA